MATATIHLVELTCYCGLPVYPSQEQYDAHKRYGQDIYCPLGHTASWGRNSKLKQAQDARREAEARATRLRAQLDQEKAAHQTSEASLRATKGHLTRLKKRIANGVCPCCKRQFKNVLGHMECKHPAFVKEMRAKEKAVS